MTFLRLLRIEVLGVKLSGSLLLLYAYVQEDNTSAYSPSPLIMALRNYLHKTKKQVFLQDNHSGLSGAQVKEEIFIFMT